MAELKLYQIGLGSFGRYGFEKLVEMHNHLGTVDVELVGVADTDPGRLERAQKFAEANGVEVELFGSVDRLYSHASSAEDVMVYDASPSNEHADHLHRSVENGFFHLAEKPPSVTRDEHMMERRLEDAMWKVDFIERESPVVMRAEQLLQAEKIDEVRVYRESTHGLRKLLSPSHRSGVAGGDVLDKMTHEIYVLDLLEAAGNTAELELEDAFSEFFMPFRTVSDSLMSVSGSKTSSLDEAASGMSSAALTAGDTTVELNSSWLGPSRASVEEVADLDHDPFQSQVSGEESSFRDVECRFFVVEGSRRLLGDMLHGRLLDLESGEELELPSPMHDQLYRVMRRSVEVAAGETEPRGSRTLEYMGRMFDVMDRARGSASSFHTELEKAKKRVDSLIVEQESFEPSRLPVRT